MLISLKICLKMIAKDTRMNILTYIAAFEDESILQVYYKFIHSYAESTIFNNKSSQCFLLNTTDENCFWNVYNLNTNPLGSKTNGTPKYIENPPV